MNGMFYNTWEHNGVRIVDNYETKQMELFFKNGNKQFSPMQFKGEKYLDEKSLEKRVNDEMVRYEIAYIILWIIYLIGSIFVWNLLSTIIILPIGIISMYYHKKWVKNHYYGIFKEHFYKTREIRNREKELRNIDFLILQYK